MTDLPPLNTKYREDCDDEIVEMSARGCTLAEICAEMCVSRGTYKLWIDPESGSYRPSFAAAALIADELREAYYTRLAREHMVYEKDGPRIDSALFKVFIQNVGKNWRDKAEVSVPQLPQAVFHPPLHEQPNPEESE